MGKKQKSRVAGLGIDMIEYQRVISGIEQTLLALEREGFHAAAVTTTPSDACGLWHDDEPELDGRFWWPYGHGSRGRACASGCWAGMFFSWQFTSLRVGVARRHRLQAREKRGAILWLRALGVNRWLIGIYRVGFSLFTARNNKMKD